MAIVNIHLLEIGFQEVDNKNRMQRFFQILPSLHLNTVKTDLKKNNYQQKNFF